MGAPLQDGRDSLFAKLRRLTVPASDHPEVATPLDLPQRLETSPDSDFHTMIQNLESELRRLSGEFRRARTVEEVPAIVIKFAQDSGYQRIAVNSDPILSECRLASRLKNSGHFEQVYCDADTIPAASMATVLAECHLGITGCEAIIADTATIILNHSGFGGRSISLLPQCHLVVARRMQLYRTLDDWMDFQRSTQRALPTCLTFVTGPSRTADIEKVLVTGVHGPLGLVLILMD